MDLFVDLTTLVLVGYLVVHQIRAAWHGPTPSASPRVWDGLARPGRERLRARLAEKAARRES